eukprot:5624963-Prorocentrum_lima.AAC.1
MTGVSAPFGGAPALILALPHTQVGHRANMGRWELSCVEANSEEADGRLWHREKRSLRRQRFRR